MMSENTGKFGSIELQWRTVISEDIAVSNFFWIRKGAFDGCYGQ
jgi:hypothetical protein